MDPQVQKAFCQKFDALADDEQEALVVEALTRIARDQAAHPRFAVTIEDIARWTMFAAGFDLQPHCSSSDDVCVSVRSIVFDWCATGRGFPAFGATNRHDFAVVLTSAGHASLMGDTVHPLSDAYPRGLADLPEEVRARLEDAARCYQHGLLRPALVMVGVGFEYVVTHIAEKLKIEDRRYAQLLAKVHDRFVGMRSEPNPKPGEGPAIDEAITALSEAAVCVRLRNAASHPDPTDPKRVHVATLLQRAPHWIRQLLAAPIKP